MQYKHGELQRNAPQKFKLDTAADFGVPFQD
jgi:hypothetical protein